MERLARTDPDIPVIVITAHSDLDSAVSAYQGGAFEYLPKPFDIDEAIELVSRAARQRSRDATEQTTVEAHAAHHRSGAGDAGGVQGDRSAIALEHDGADHGRIGHRQGARGARAARQLAARRRPVRRAEYLGHRRRAARVGAVRPREGRVHGRDRAAHRPLRAGQRRHAVPRRDRRHVAGVADAVVARARRERVLPGRRPNGDPRRRARDRGNASGPRARRRDRPFPRGPLSPPERHAHRGAAAAPAARGHPRAVAVLPRASGERARRRAEDAERRRHRSAAALRLARQRPRARQCLPPADGDGRRPRDRRAGPACRARRSRQVSPAPIGRQACRSGRKRSSRLPSRRRS